MKESIRQSNLWEILPPKGQEYVRLRESLLSDMPPVWKRKGYERLGQMYTDMKYGDRWATDIVIKAYEEKL